MVSVKIAGEERKLEEADSQWIRERIGRRMQERQLICVEVTINMNDVNVHLSTPACAGAAGAGREPNPREAEILKLWRRHRLNTNEFNFGQVEAFLNQLRHMVR